MNNGAPDIILILKPILSEPVPTDPEPILELITNQYRPWNLSRIHIRPRTDANLFVAMELTLVLDLKKNPFRCWNWTPIVIGLRTYTGFKWSFSCYRLMIDPGSLIDFNPKPVQELVHSFSILELFLNSPQNLAKKARTHGSFSIKV